MATSSAAPAAPPSPAQALNSRLQRLFLRRVVERSRYENHALRSILTEWRRAQRTVDHLVRTSGLFPARPTGRAREGLGLVWPDRQAGLMRLLDTIANVLGGMSLHAMEVLQADLPALVELELRELPPLITQELQRTAEQLEEAAPDPAVLQEYIVKVADGYRIISHRTGKNLGTFRTRAAAQRHLAHLAKFREAMGHDPSDEDVAHLLAEQTEAAVNAVFNSVPLATVTELLGTPLGGAHFAASFGDLSATLLMRLRNTLLTGLTQGQAVPAVARSVSGVLGNARWQAERIVRSEFGRVANQAALSQFESNQDVLRGVQWLATLDQRTCLQCSRLDRRFWADARRAKVPVVDTHPNCRCTLIPLIKGLPGVTLPAGMRASMGGEVPATLRYQDWFGEQTPALQREILGPTRYELWRRGDVKLPDFASARGVRSVREVLRELDGGRSREQAYSFSSSTLSSSGFGGPWEAAKMKGGKLPGVRLREDDPDFAGIKVPLSGPKLLAQLETLPASHLALIKQQGGVRVTLKLNIAGANGTYGERSGIEISSKAQNPGGTVIHEFGHAVDYKSRHVAQTSAFLSDAYVSAVGSERVTQYASTNSREAFAEAYAMYASPAGRASMATTAPRSLAFMERVFTSDLSSQAVVRGFHPHIWGSTP